MTASPTSMPSKGTIRRAAQELGIDLIGFCDWHSLEERAPDYDKPSRISTYLRTLVVLGRRYPTGVACSSDDALRQFAMGRTARHLEEATAELAYWFEKHDCIAALLSAIVPDLRSQPLGYSIPAGQGSLLLRLGAVAAGLGSLGLNEMLLTPQFGPRLFVTGIVTDLEVDLDDPLDGELCPGLEQCGRCAAVCPVSAIPTEAPVDASLSETRAIDGDACASASQPWGPARMVEHLETIFAAESGDEAAVTIRSQATQQLFYHLTVTRQGAYTGCARCELVCPVGEDYAAIEASTVRKRDLPADLESTVEGDIVRIGSVRR